MGIKKRHEIMVTYEGPMDEILAHKGEDNVSMADVIDMLGKLAFIGETVAHMKGMEAGILPTTDKAHAMIAKLQGE